MQSINTKKKLTPKSTKKKNVKSVRKNTVKTSPRKDIVKKKTTRIFSFLFNTLVVLALIGLIVIAVFYAQNLYLHYQQKNIVTDITETVRAIHKNKADNYADAKKYTARNIFFAGHAQSLNYNGDQKQFVFEIANITKDVCVEIATHDWTYLGVQELVLSRSLYSEPVQGQPNSASFLHSHAALACLNHCSIRLPLNIQDAQNLCNGSRLNLTLIFN